MPPRTFLKNRITIYKKKQKKSSSKYSTKNIRQPNDKTEVKGNSQNKAKQLQNYITVEDKDFNFIDVDINSLPILFSDGILCNEEITLSTDGRNITNNDEAQRFFE